MHSVAMIFVNILVAIFVINVSLTVPQTFAPVTITSFRHLIVLQRRTF